MAILTKKRKGDHSSRIHPDLDRSPKENWVDKVGGLPDYIKRIAKHIHYDSGLSISHAIAAAVERVKVLAAKGNPEAIKALAEWNAKRARSKAKTAAKKLAWDSEEMEWEVIELAEFDTKTRSRLASQGKAMPGGRFPIRNASDLHNAIRAVGRAKGGAAGRAQVRRYIMRRARELGLSNLIPDSWKSKGSVDLGLLRNKQGQSAPYGQAGAGFDEGKHPRGPSTGQFAAKIDPSQLIAARRRVEGMITNLQVGQRVELPENLGWVRRDAGGYFVQGPAGYSASVTTLSSAIQAAAIILAGKVKAAA
jgi:hypothetical protein